MVQRRLGNNRVIGRVMGDFKGSSPNTTTYSRGMTPEQIAERDENTKAAYEVWRKEREARKAKRFDAVRARNLGYRVVTQDPA